MKQGKISQVIGPVVDVVFDGDYLPRIKEALTVEVEGKKLVMEVAKHMGGRTVRCILLDAAEGLARDMIVTATGSAISVPVGPETLGRMFNVLGETIDKAVRTGFGTVRSLWLLWLVYHRLRGPFPWALAG